MSHPLGVKYRKGELNTVPVLNCQEFFRWFSTTNLGWRDPGILGDNRESFKKLWGKMDFSFKGEFYFHCWVREFEGETFVVLTAKGKGTCVEMLRPPGRGVDSKAEVIKRFALDLQRQIDEAS